jgi:hypothetical protein
MMPIEGARQQFHRAAERLALAGYLTIESGLDAEVGQRLTQGVIARERGQPSHHRPILKAQRNNNMIAAGYWVPRFRGTPSRCARRGPLAGHDT